MRLLATLGYQAVLFGKTADYARIIEALGTAQMVEHNYGTKTYEVKRDSEIEVKLINDDDIRLPDVPKDEAHDRYLAISKERDALQLKVWELERAVKAADTKVAGVAETLKKATDDIPF